VTEGTATGTVGVFPVDAKAASGLDAEVAGSPFSTGGNSPNSISFDSKGQFAYVPNSGSGNVAEFKIGAGGVLTAVSGSPVASGAGPSFAAID